MPSGAFPGMLHAERVLSASSILKGEMRHIFCLKGRNTSVAHVTLNTNPSESEETLPLEWQQALELAGELYQARRLLDTNRDRTLSHLTKAFRSSERRRALLLLHSLDPSYTVALTDILVEYALSHRDALLVRQIFGRLPHVQLRALVPAAVWRCLDTLDPNDDDAYLRFAELFYHLGLSEALHQLCNRALASENPALREVVEDCAAEEDNAEG